jgi:glycosyltransferase involved in cell wall biosynthesis
LDNLGPNTQEINSSNYEIIVSNDSLINPELQLLKEEYPFIRFINGSKKGPAANRNNGAKHAKSD